MIATNYRLGDTITKVSLVGCAMGSKLLKHEIVSHNSNKRIALQTMQLLPGDFPRDFLLELSCECERTDCFETVGISVGEYEEFIKVGHEFIVKPGHFDAAVDETIYEAADYWIVTKKKITSLDQPQD